MGILTLNPNLQTGRNENLSPPRTSRGRALYTVDWFLNGRPVLSDHDNPRLQLRGGCPC